MRRQEIVSYMYKYKYKYLIKGFCLFTRFSSENLLIQIGVIGKYEGESVIVFHFMSFFIWRVAWISQFHITLCKYVHRRAQFFEKKWIYCLLANLCLYDECKQGRSQGGWWAMPRFKQSCLPSQGTFSPGRTKKMNLFCSFQRLICPLKNLIPQP